MSEQAAALARQFAEANQEVIAVVEACPDERWRAHHAGEDRPVNVLADHIALGHQAIAGWVQGLAGGRTGAPLDRGAFDARNAQHARERIDVTKPEVLAALRRHGAAAEALVRGLSDEQLAREGELFAGRRVRTQDAVERILIGHPRNHLASIREAIAG